MIKFMLIINKNLLEWHEVANKNHHAQVKRERERP